MNNFILIYNHSRKYCIDKIDEIRCKYKEIDKKLSNDLSYKIPVPLENEILNDSIRMDILKSILILLEKYDVKNEELCKKQKEFIKEIYKKPIIDYKKYRRELKSKIDIICKTEISKLDKYIDNINLEDAEFNDLQLFYRHVLTNKEYSEKRKAVLDRVNEFKQCKIIKYENFIKEYKDKIYGEIESKYKNEYIYELNLSEYSYILDIKGINFISTFGFDTYWFDNNLNWVIEKNHEGWYHIYF